MIITLTFVVLGCGILFGILPALIFTLLILFFIGSAMFFTELGHTNSFFSQSNIARCRDMGRSASLFRYFSGKLA